MNRSNLPRRAWATVLAICAHLLALLALGWRIPKLAEPARTGDQAGAITVTLVRPPLRQPPKAEAQTPRPAPPAPSSPRVLISPTPGAPALSAPEPAPPAAAEAAPNPSDKQVRNTLRGLLGCADPAIYHLTTEEREACNRRLAAAPPAPVTKQYSPEELAQFEAENKYDPILVRKAHDNCLPRVADRPPKSSGPPPSIRSGATTTFGLSCAKSF